jgi:hypothetical protein
MEKLFRLKRELINKNFKSIMPNICEVEKPLFWWKSIIIIDEKHLEQCESQSDKLREKIFNTIRDLSSDFLYYDRKEDQILDMETLNQAVNSGIITVDEMVEEFRLQLMNTYSK